MLVNYILSEKSTRLFYFLISASVQLRFTIYRLIKFIILPSYFVNFNKLVVFRNRSSVILSEITLLIRPLLEL